MKFELFEVGYICIYSEKSGSKVEYLHIFKNQNRGARASLGWLASLGTVLDTSVTLPQCLQGRRRIVPEAVLGGVVLGGDQNQTRGRQDAYDRPSVAYQLSKPTWPVFGARPATGRPVGGPRATRRDGGSGARACERQRRGVLKQEPPPLLQCEGNRRSPRAQRRDFELTGN